MPTEFITTPLIYFDNTNIYILTTIKYIIKKRNLLFISLKKLSQISVFTFLSWSPHSIMVNMLDCNIIVSKSWKRMLVSYSGQVLEMQAGFIFWTSLGNASWFLILDKSWKGMLVSYSRQVLEMLAGFLF